MQTNKIRMALVCTLLLPIGLQATTRLEALPENFAEIRDPMLPTDYQADPQAKDPIAIQREAMAAQIQWPRLQLRGITHAGGRKFIAVIDQIGLVEEGEEVRMRHENLIYTWRIDKISASGLSTTRVRVAPAENPQQPLRGNPAQAHEQE